MLAVGTAVETAADMAAVPAVHDHITAAADRKAEDERILGYCNLHTAAAAGCTMVVVRLLVQQAGADMLDLQIKIFQYQVSEK